MAQIARALKRQGKCFMSMFLLTPESVNGMQSKDSRTFPYPFQIPQCRVADRNEPESAVAYEEPFIRKLCAKHGLRIMEPITYGRWWQDAPNSQDFLWTVKE